MLIDQNLPQRLAEALNSNGHDALHTQDVQLSTADDPVILTWCCQQRRVLVTADKKLTKFLASNSSECPSVVVVREMRTSRAETILALLVSNLPQIERAIIEHGEALFSVSSGKPIRAELLPIGVGG